MTSKDYGENYVFISVCVYLVSLVHRKEIARGRGTPEDTKGTYTDTVQHCLLHHCQQ